MGKIMNKPLSLLLFFLSLSLWGCDSLLYSNRLAPVYSASGNATNSNSPPLLNPSSSTTPAIENAGPNSVVINSTQNNPYAITPLPTPTETTATAVTPHPVVDTTAASAAIPNTGVAVDGQPVVKEGQDVIKEKVYRPTKAIQNSAQTTVEKTTEQVEKATNTVATTAKETANEAVTATTKPQPTTPKTATKSLLQEARVAVAAGDYEKAASALERAHRIEPGNAKILYDISQIRYAQGKYRQAASFASKAANYSSSPALSKKIWSLLSNARKALGNSTGAQAAAKKAASF